MNLKTHLNTILLVIVAGLIFLLPLFFLPFTINFFETNKILLLVLATILITIAWSLVSLVRRHVALTITPFTWPIVLVGLSYTLSLFFSGSNRVESLMGKGLLIPLLTIFFLMVSSAVTNRRFIKFTLYTTIAGSVILSFITIFQAIGGFPATLLNQIAGTKLSSSLSFTPAGSPLALLGFLLPITLVTTTLALTRKAMLEKIALLLFASIMAGSIVVTTAFILKKDNTPRFVSYKTDWAITLETFKDSGRASLVGFGPESYTTAYSQNRPIATNLLETWNTRFNVGSNEPFTTAATTGIIGLASWIFLTITILKNFASSQPLVYPEQSRRATSSQHLPAIKVGTLCLLIYSLLLPHTLLSLALSYIFLSLWALELKLTRDTRVHSWILASSSQSRDRVAPLSNVAALDGAPARAGQLPAYPEQSRRATSYQLHTSLNTLLATVPLMFLMLYLSIVTAKAYGAEVTFKQSLDAAQDNASKSYELQRSAILKNPYLTSYRRTYAITNLALANALSQKQDLSDQDKQTVTQLIQQAIREAKASTVLDPQNPSNWETLATIYRNIINVAQSATEWTVSAYAQAIQHDPVSPRLRLELGGIFYNIKRYDDAIRLFQQAIELKPDWANAYYNLASAYKQKGETANAYSALVRTVELLDPKSPDYTKAQDEANALKDELVKTQAEQKDETLEAGEPTILATPIPLPTPAPQQIRLPDDAGIASPSGEAQ